MSFQKHIETATNHLRGIGIEPETRTGRSITSQDLDEAEEEMGIPLPDELRQYLIQMGDGFQWGYSAESITGNGDHEFSCKFIGTDKIQN